jgi:aminopeptidase N
MGPFALPGAERHYAPDLELEPVHLELVMRLDIEGESATATVTHAVEARRASSPTLTLHAVGFVDVGVRDRDDRAIDWRYDGKQIIVRWSDAFASGERRHVVVDYRVVRPVTGLTFSRPSEAEPDAPFFAATDSETERARHWLACVDLPSARPRLDLHLRADARFAILANGALVAEQDHGDGTKTAHWRLDTPCPSYLTCFAVGDFVRVDDGEHEGVPVAYFATPAFDESHLSRTFGRTRAMLAWMTKKLDLAFPFPKYYQIALPRFGGAMENISLVTWDDRFLLDESLATEWSRLADQINVHEMAHSYFGDLVVIRDFAHAWLKESWATYLEQCWFEDRVSEDEGCYEFVMNADAYIAEADGRYQRPIVTREFSSSFELYDRHLYPGGACRLHVLRSELGDDTFWEGVRLYVRRFAGRVVETDDFRRCLEEVSGRSLARFFDQWFHTAAYPSLKVTYAWDGERREATLDLEQTQAGAADGSALFDLLLDVAFVDASGAAREEKWRIRRAREKVVFALDEAPKQVRLDPNGRLLFKLEFNPGEDLLVEQLRRAKDVGGRIHAGRELCKAGKRSGIEAVGKAYARERFWGVRLEWARALSDAGTADALEVLRTCVQTERSGLVFEGLFRAAAAHRHAGLRDAVYERVTKGELPHRALGAAYEALGSQRDAAPYDLLLSASERRAFGGFSQAGALFALAATRRPAARDVLVRATQAGSVAESARASAVSALAELSRLMDPGPRARSIERCVDLLNDPNVRVREAAVVALESLAASEALGALEAHGRSLAEQHEVRVRRAIAAIRATATPRGVEQEKALDALRERLRRAEESIARLEAEHKAKKPAKPAARPAKKPKRAAVTRHAPRPRRKR